MLLKANDARRCRRACAAELRGWRRIRPPSVRRFHGHRAEIHWRSSKIFPIMHTIVLKRDVRGNRWIAMNLLKAFEEAKDRSMERIGEATAARVPLPWAFEHVRRVKAEFGDDFVYGIEASSSAFLGFALRAGVTKRLVSPESCSRPRTRPSRAESRRGLDPSGPAAPGRRRALEGCGPEISGRRSSRPAALALQGDGSRARRFKSFNSVQSHAASNRATASGSAARPVHRPWHSTSARPSARAAAVRTAMPSR